MKNNDIKKKPLNSLIDIDKKILPFFSNPIILKRISDQKKNKNLNLLNPQKKLIYKIIKLNENLTKFSLSIKNYNLNLDSFFLSNQDALSQKLDINVGNKSEFILFIRNNLYYNLKSRLSNILYKVEKFTPVLKFHSLLNNINLFVPKRLFKPQPYIRFTYRMIRINNNFNFKKNFPAALKYQEEEGYKSILPQQGNVSPLARPTAGREGVLIKINTYNEQPGHTVVSGLFPVNNNNTSPAHPRLPGLRRDRTKGIGITNIKDYSIIQLHKFENGRSINYILLKLNSLLNEIENMINIKNKLIKSIKVKNINKNLSNLDSNDLVQVESIDSNNKTLANTPVCVGGANSITPSSASSLPTLVTVREEKHSDQSVKNLRLKIKKINSYNSNNNNNIETYPLLVEAGMVKENIIKIDQASLTIPRPSIIPARTGGQEVEDVVEKGVKADHAFTLPDKGFISAGFDKEKDIINENSNPVDLLYFNNNLKKPVLNQYLKSMSTYNMITNGTILYYSNIIGFNFKKRIREYLPFINSISVVKLKESVSSHPSPVLEEGVGVRGSERLTSPYTFRGLRKVVGALDKGKFSVFGRGVENNKLINNIYKFLYLSFKSMYCLISKPVFIIKSNKITIQLFYFLLIPKIFKHIKSITNYKPRNKKKIYSEFLKKKRRVYLATIFETRFKLREDALKIKHFSQLGSLDTKSAQVLKLETLYQEWLELRNTEEKSRGVIFDDFGKVTFKSLEEKIIEIKKITLQRISMANARLRQKFKFIKKINKNNRNKIKKNFWFYKTFFKRFEFNKNNNGHILRIPRKWVNAKKKNSPKFKFFKYLALTYLNIFKVRHPMLNRIKLFKLRQFQKKIIRDKSDLFYGLQLNGRGRTQRNKFNSYDKINWFLFKKLFWSIRLSKKILPNVKILQKLGIPQWCWPYNSINKKGYSYSYTEGAGPLSIVGQKRWEVLQPTQPSEASATTTNTQGGESYSINNWESSWPFSLLMPPAYKQRVKSKKVNHSKVDYDIKINKEGLVVSESLEAIHTGRLYKPKTRFVPISQQAVRQEEKSKNKQSRYRITELDTRRYHLMKLANINLIKIYPLKFEKLCEVLNSIFNKPVELDLIRLHYPYNDSNILVRLLAFMINKLKVRRITRRLFNKAVIKSIKKINNKDQVNIIPAFLSGMTIKVAGRLMKYKVIPRKTVKIVRRGSSSIGKVNYSDISRYTNKNKRGSFSITINSGQNFI